MLVSLNLVNFFKKRLQFHITQTVKLLSIMFFLYVLCFCSLILAGFLCFNLSVVATLFGHDLVWNNILKLLSISIHSSAIIWKALFYKVPTKFVEIYGVKNLQVGWILLQCLANRFYMYAIPTNTFYCVLYNINVSSSSSSSPVSHSWLQ